MKTRREFLALLGAAATAGAQVDPLARRGPAQRVIVLGAGLAGLCVGFELQSQGHEVAVLEAQSRPGGRVRTLREGLAPGLYCEAGPETIPGSHDLTQHYANAFGLKLAPVRIPNTRFFYHARGRRLFMNEQPEWPFDLTEEERRLGYAGLSKKYIGEATQQAIAAGWSKDIGRALSTWDKMKPGEWLRSRGASAGAAELLSFGFGTEFGSAASFLLHGLNTMGSGTGSFRIEGGNEQLPQEFAKRVKIRYGAPVVAVSQNESGVRVVVRSGESLTADRAVCAMPCPVVGRIFQEARLSEAKQRAIREQNYARVVKVFLQSRTRFWLKEGLSGFLTTDLPIERMTPDPGTNEAERGALAAYPMAGYTAELERMSGEERVAAAFDQAQQIFPDFGKTFEGGISKSWGLDPWQRGSFALHNPGQIGFITTLGTREGRIHFAGEHTSPWTGWMQGALESARRVVREVNG